MRLTSDLEIPDSKPRAVTRSSTFLVETDVYKRQVGTRRDGSHGEVMNGAHIFVSTLGEFQDRIVHQGAKSSEQEQCEVGARA